eukprot:CAMPEP_0176362328 /NCGR_PEP_ID=MMETSP0126-20121128/18355_1 /TAXON_ID=141414 ORGANISM="Strombidinopsis acuminatum, Strain SPMC142" /NCGR_SAMPLE_ID=MMETSP0126 /ASSEMBLY_ACC=CAM_ASM_000229 /LENGTH=36 /DNA_ID= /DNA_START= /DNA_END= /DNA_ORIENTATION=
MGCKFDKIKTQHQLEEVAQNEEDVAVVKVAVTGDRY